ncbi:hypothetical protein THAOC_16465 [Thalassiosira oceanica]|uniref:Uncharacterized protein n=1 Tax=Thalassiosira oceanica TaxID=159749 RepID=K0SXD3_THAOC|nr:hypothetical protein THAOC_16465 [Thalassiosira oceanica]|eukprot:EJK62907.1 hypothetical protein THAOC_16465 [Thalassiosira oceanica]
MSHHPHRRRAFLTIELATPILLAVGLGVFTKSFFLSRTPFRLRSPCDIGSAGDLLSDTLGISPSQVDFLRGRGFLSDYEFDVDASGGAGALHHGCWAPRRVDSMAIMVVDALRFDFARDHLPKSIGSRLYPSNITHSAEPRGKSKLFQFVADPPTVTMQRLKGLTTGGLPTFADITGSFGGATLDEDSWVEQLVRVPWQRRRYDKSSRIVHKPQIAFVGDDTWVDLFPTQFDDAHPYPSFNTRDLDTVDNGCLLHLPRLMGRFIGLKTGTQLLQMSPDSPLELIVAHFLGVDHVGHTYGPNNVHMDKKLHQMDVVLSDTLDAIDNAPGESCTALFVFGDHGMTEDGNHGGGTLDEMNAGLFAHFSPGCHAEDDEGLSLDGSELSGPDAARAFESIHQIDLVPTISFLLGLPLPFANIGGVVPDLLPTPKRIDSERISHAPELVTPHAAVALALNAAQVWNYFFTYSKTSRDLPKDRIRQLKDLLDSASLTYRDAIDSSIRLRDDTGKGNNREAEYYDSTAYRQACSLFKLFFGREHWPWEDGMDSVQRSWDATWHFYYVRCLAGGQPFLEKIRSAQLWAALPLAVAICARVNDVFVTGHGLDPSLRSHRAHHPAVFIPSMMALATIRRHWFAATRLKKGASLIDTVAIVCLTMCWWDKRAADHGRNGFMAARISMVAVLLGLAHSIYEILLDDSSNKVRSLSLGRLNHFELLAFRLMVFLVIVTGPSAASTAVLIAVECAALKLMSLDNTRVNSTTALVMAALWKLSIRTAFYGTSHHCSFNQLQFSAAFVATTEFQFHIAGFSLFMNTFGWEAIGSVLVLLYSRARGNADSGGRTTIWEWFVYFQATEMLSSCISHRFSGRKTERSIAYHPATRAPARRLTEEERTASPSSWEKI